MSLELEDYQRTMQSLENAMTSKESQLEEARRESKLQYEEAQKLRKDLGEFPESLSTVLRAV